jgi:6-phosphofructokinase 1
MNFTKEAEKMSNKKIKRIGVLTSGGDSPGMNAAVRSVVRTALNYGIEPMGIYHGYEGLVKNDIKLLGSKDVAGIIHRGGTILGSARSKAFRTKDGRKQAYENAMQHKLDALVTIGGDGTFTGATVFQDEYQMPVVGIPGTIDNDLFGTDYTLGFDTALNTVVEAVDKIKDTAGSHNRLFFIEVMGRDAGFIALHAGMATGAEDILVPETPTYIEDLILTLKQNKRRGKNSGIIIVAEGDDAGGAYEIAAKVKEHDHTYSTRVTILGHIQRGGRPTAHDRVLGSLMGYEAVVGLIKGKDRHMIGRIKNEYVFTPIEKAIKEHHNINQHTLDIARVLSI